MKKYHIECQSTADQSMKVFLQIRTQLEDLAVQGDAMGGSVLEDEAKTILRFETLAVNSAGN